MDNQDKVLTCATCGRSFTFTVREQEFYLEKKFIEPKHCRECRQQRKVRRQALAKEVPVGTEPGTSRSLFEVICAECGKRTQVPFKPLTGKPILCRDCFVQKKRHVGGDGVGIPFTQEIEPVFKEKSLPQLTSEPKPDGDHQTPQTAEPEAQELGTSARDEDSDASDDEVDIRADGKPKSEVSIVTPLDDDGSLDGKGSSGDEEGATTRDRE